MIFCFIDALLNWIWVAEGSWKVWYTLGGNRLLAVGVNEATGFVN